MIYRVNTEQHRAEIPKHQVFICLIIPARNMVYTTPDF